MALTLTMMAWLVLQVPLATFAGKCVKFGMGEPTTA